jgi:hypothetical protein
VLPIELEVIVIKQLNADLAREALPDSPVRPERESRTVRLRKALRSRVSTIWRQRGEQSDRVADACRSPAELQDESRAMRHLPARCGDSPSA